MEILRNGPEPIKEPDYNYWCWVPDRCLLFPNGKEPTLDVYDGDTARLVIDLGFSNFVGPLYYRLYGIQCPEIRPRATRYAGIAARDHLIELIERYNFRSQSAGHPCPGRLLIVRTHKKMRPKRDYRPRAVRGKYGRFLVELFGKDGDQFINLNERMIKDGQAEAYTP